MAPSGSRQQKGSPNTGEYKKIAEQWAKAKRSRQSSERQPPTVDDDEARAENERIVASGQRREAVAARRRAAYNRRWWWTVTFWTWLLAVHVVGLLLFSSGFLLTRLVLDDQSSCSAPPVEVAAPGNAQDGCWHPRSFDRAVIVLIDALRYDFVVPRPEGVEAKEFHDAMPVLYETAMRHPQNAFLRPFIADPPTTTLQRLKGLTTGTLPTFVDMGSNFAGTAIDEDNLLGQLRVAGRRIVHLGDDTWWSLFPGHFEDGLSRPYDSFNVWDLHTVDDGVIEHLLPLVAPGRPRDWDLLIGHCLGVDHAGHRYGPDHPAMAAKLRQMDAFVRNVTAALDDDTLLVVMGDHGMDGKGDHGGESDDEVEAALWMYAKRPFFGRTRPEFVAPPPTAKVRPVAQIDLVPTLALLLGIPVPYNNLGRPIEEAFAGISGADWANLATASRVTAAGIRRYQESYFAARGISRSTAPGSPAALWASAEETWGGDGSEWEMVDPQAAYVALTHFQEETLRMCRSLWARFDVPKMAAGLSVMGLGVVSLILYAARDPGDDDDAEPMKGEESASALDFFERGLEPGGSENDDGRGGGGGGKRPPYKTLHRRLVYAAGAGAVCGAGLGGTLAGVAAAGLDGMYVAGATALASAASVSLSLAATPGKLSSLVPSTPWGWLALVFTVGQAVGFGSNSYTVWEDTNSLFFIATFGLATFVSSFRARAAADRALSASHSVTFMLLARLAFLSRLCREEQMPYCKSTYYASSTSSTSAPWQLVIPFAVAGLLPSVVRHSLLPSRSYQGLAPGWVGFFFRSMLFLAAGYWLLDAADNAGWFAGAADAAWSVPPGMLKATSVWLARLLLALTFAAGTTAFVYTGPCVDVSVARSRIEILGFANAHGARYLLLPLNVVAALVLVSKPMGGGALALMLWQVLTLADLLDLNSLKTHPVGGVVLGLMGNFYFFRTGHQAVLSTIQWDSAFVPLYAVRYPWSPLLVALNTFAGQVLAVACAPLLLLWQAGPRRRAVLEHAARRVLAPLVAYHAVQALAGMACAGWLRRHLMLYRVFGPRFMTAAAVLVVVEVVGIVVALGGVRANTYGVSDLFGWAD